MNTESFISQIAASSIEALYGEVNPAQIQIQKTRKEFEGDYTLVAFPLLKLSRKSPEATATELGEHIVANNPQISAYNVIKGFLNLSIAPACWLERFAEVAADENFGMAAPSTIYP